MRIRSRAATAVLTVGLVFGGTGAVFASTGLPILGGGSASQKQYCPKDGPKKNQKPGNHCGQNKP